MLGLPPSDSPPWTAQAIDWCTQDCEVYRLNATKPRSPLKCCRTSAALLHQTYKQITYVWPRLVLAKVGRALSVLFHRSLLLPPDAYVEEECSSEEQHAGYEVCKEARDALNPVRLLGRAKWQSKRPGEKWQGQKFEKQEHQLEYQGISKSGKPERTEMQTDGPKACDDMPSLRKKTDVFIFHKPPAGSWARSLGS